MMSTILKSLLVATLVWALSACGGQEHSGHGEHGADSTAIPKSADFNQADVDFATAMIPHHAQAPSMVDLTAGRTLSPEVAALAERIRTAQSPEIETMVGWLTEWEQPVPETSRDHANAHSDHGGGDDGEQSEGAHADMPGMMSEQQMSDLEAAQGPAFEKKWLSMMIEHHEGAIAMAETENKDGEASAAKTLAGEIIEAQRAEIAQMRTLLDS